MEIIFEPEAEQDLEKLDEEHQRFIIDRLRELEKRPTGHEDSDIIRVKGSQLFKFVMKKDSTRGGKDYRAVYDIIDGEIRVIAVFHRNKGYDKNEIDSRS